MDRCAVTVRVSGVVQGVGYRWFTLTKAQGLGVAGWVRNNGDGSVSVQVEGSRAAVAAMVACLRCGPRAAVVDEVDVRAMEPTGLRSFDVR